MTSVGAVGQKGRKTFALDNIAMAWAHAGAVSVMDEANLALQRIDEQCADSNQRAAFEGADRSAVREIVANALRPVLSTAYQTQIQIPGQQVQPPFTQFLTATWTRNDPLLLEVGIDGQVTEHPAFWAIGSGNQLAMVAQALVEHLLDDGVPPLELGLRLVFRTIETICTVSSQFIGMPAQIAIVNRSGARLLGPNDYNALGEAVAGWKQIEREVFTERLGQTTAGDIELDQVNLSEEVPPQGSVASKP